MDRAMSHGGLLAAAPPVGVLFYLVQSPDLPPAIQGVGDIGSFLMGVGAAVAAIGWVVKTFRNGKTGNGESALNAERRAVAAVERVITRIDLLREELREGQKENRQEVRQIIDQRTAEILMALKEGQ